MLEKYKISRGARRDSQCGWFHTTYKCEKIPCHVVVLRS